MTPAAVIGASYVGVVLGVLGALLLGIVFGGDSVDRGLAALDRDGESPFSPATEAAIAEALAIPNGPGIGLAVVEELARRRKGATS